MKVRDLFEEKDPNNPKLEIYLGTNYVFRDGQTTFGKLPNKVDGSFLCARGKLESLVGMPDYVGGDFDCQANKLTSLEGAPSYVGGSYICALNTINSLKGVPETINGSFDCSFCGLSSFEYFPKVIKGDFKMVCNGFISLKDIHKHIKQIDGELNTYSNQIRSNVLGLLLIKNLKKVMISTGEVMSIVNSYLPNDRGMDAVLECQAELIEAGFEDFAEL